MKLAPLALAGVLAGFPALAQQPNVLDTLKGALGGMQQQPQQRESPSRDDYQRSVQQDESLPRDAQGRVNIRAMDNRQLTEYRDSLERRGRYISQELDATDDEMRRRNLSRR